MFYSINDNPDRTPLFFSKTNNDIAKIIDTNNNTIKVFFNYLLEDRMPHLYFHDREFKKQSYLSIIVFFPHTAL